MTHGIRRHDLPALWLTRTPTGPEWAPWGPAAYAFATEADAARKASDLGVLHASIAPTPSPAAASVPPGVAS